MYGYGTTIIPREDVTPGMLVRFKNATWRASANLHKQGYLTIHTLHESCRLRDETVEVLLDKYGRLLKGE